METRNIALTLEKAKEWYNSDNEALKEAALQAFTEDELKEFDFRSIKTFDDAVNSLYRGSDRLNIYIYEKDLSRYSKASAASFKLNIIRKALNKGHEMKFDEGDVWYPNSPVLTDSSPYCKEEKEIEVAKVKVNNKIYTLIGGGAFYGGNVYFGGITGLGCISSYYSMGTTDANPSFLGCATEEIAEHFSRYFAKEIFEAKYDDFVNFEWV